MRAKWLPVVLALFLAGCASPSSPTAITSPVAMLEIQHTSALRFLGPVFFDCAHQQEELGIYIDERPAAALTTSDGIALRWGVPRQITGFAAEIGRERLAVIVHPSSPLDALTREQVSSIYTGKATAWSDFLSPSCETCSPDGSPPLGDEEILALGYAQGEDIQSIFEEKFNLPDNRNAAAVLPHPEAVRTMVASNLGSIGFIPARNLDSSVKELSITGMSAEALRQPILALLNADPQGPARTWLVCVQDSLTR